MFRELTRKNKALSREECEEILRAELRGVLSVLGDDDYPYGVPLNHYWSDEDGKLYFHGGKTGHRVDAMRRHDKASFCVFDQGRHVEGDWALHVRSVIVFGRLEAVEDEAKLDEIARKLSHKFTQDEGYIEREIRGSGPVTLMFALVPEHMSGKWVAEK